MTHNHLFKSILEVINERNNKIINNETLENDVIVFAVNDGNIGMELYSNLIKNAIKIGMKVEMCVEILPNSPKYIYLQNEYEEPFWVRKLSNFQKTLLNNIKWPYESVKSNEHILKIIPYDTDK